MFEQNAIPTIEGEPEELHWKLFSLAVQFSLFLIEGLNDQLLNPLSFISWDKVSFQSHAPFWTLHSVEHLMNMRLKTFWTIVTYL